MIPAEEDKQFYQNITQLQFLNMLIRSELQPV